MKPNYIKNISDEELRTLYRQAEEYQRITGGLDIPSEEYPELRKYTLESCYLEKDEKFSSSLAKAMLIINIMEEIVQRFMKE